ncbi:MAG: dienelactone hydrolase family protein [Planctomycetota bacterium]
MALPLEEEVTYSADGVELRGFLARPAGAAEARPSVLVVHEWWGHNDYARRRARELADLGYVALAVDMYGEGKSASHPEDAGAFMQALLKDRPTMVARFDAGLALLRSQPDVDGDSVAAIGYCMGGGVVLDMAREGRDLDAVVSFHGLLSTGLQAEPGAVQAGILVLTGADDPMAGQAERDAFVAEMDAAGVDGYGMVVYPGVRHAFTNADATRLGEEFGLEQALRYDAGADADSWQRMKDFLQMSFAAE